MAAKHKPRDGFGKAILIVAVGHEIRRALHIGISIAHRNAQPASFEHRDVVAAIADDGDLRGRDGEQLRQRGQRDALVGERMGEVEVVRLRAGDRRPIGEQRQCWRIGVQHY